MNTLVYRRKILLLLLLVVLPTGIVQARHAYGPVTGMPGRQMVVVDPGHGGKDSGTIGVTGDKEKDIVLAVGRRLAEGLASQGVKTVMTRSTDHFVDLATRPALANRLGAGLLVSIHANSNPDHRMHGSTVYIRPHASRRTLAIARAIEHALVAAGFPSLCVREHPYRVLVNSRCPAMLVELGFLSNAAENDRLSDAQVRDRCAQAISRGIIRELK